MCFTDRDSDGDSDLAVANNYSDNVSILLNNGDGTFAAPVNYGAGDGPASVFAIDLDSDGDSDLAVAKFDSDNISILLNLSGPLTDATILPPSVPKSIVIKAIYPNPFNPHTTIVFSLPRKTHVHLAIYNVRGALVKTLIDGLESEGENVITWNGLNEYGARVSSGVYFCRLKMSGKAISKKMVLLR